MGVFGSIFFFWVVDRLDSELWLVPQLWERSSGLSIVCGGLGVAWLLDNRSTTIYEGARARIDRRSHHNFGYVVVVLGCLICRSTNMSIFSN